MKTVDVIIPTYKPGKKLVKIIDSLENQTYPVNKIILINTEEKYFLRSFGSSHYFDQYNNVTLKHISALEFDHGGTRRMAVSMSDSDYFICMTDDAVPEDNMLVENLISSFDNDSVAAAYAKQCVGKKANEIEKYTRKFNYPSKSRLKTKDDLEELGIKTYFCSNVCAAYDRAVYDSLGGFVKHTIFNEDMIYAANVISAGYGIYYNADAKVTHYHSYTNMQQLRRNFDLGVSQADYPEIFDKVKSTTEGKKLVKQTAKHLKKIGQGNKVFGMYVTSAYKYIGYKLGKNYRKLPDKMVKKLTMNLNYWSKGDVARIMIDPYAGYGRSEVEKTWNNSIKKKK